MRRGLAIVVAALVVGVVVDIGLWGGVLGLGASLAIAVAAGALVAVARHRTLEVWLLCGAAALVGSFLAFFASPWLVTFDWIFALGLLALAATAHPDRPLRGASLPLIVARSSLPWAAAPITAFVGLYDAAVPVLRRDRSSAESAPLTPASASPPSSNDSPSKPPVDPSPVSGAAGRSAHAGAVGRGLLIALPVVLVLGLLLGSADAVFASFFDVPVPSLSLVTAIAHLLLVGVGAGAFFALKAGERAASEVPTSSLRPLGAIEASVVLGAMTLLYGVFAIAQVVAAAGGDDRVQSTTGLTYAEYARSGFFQLLWAAGITFAVLLGIRALTKDTAGRQLVLLRTVSTACCLLTLVVVGSAIRRLDVYQAAYGQTMLRLACTTFAWMLGAAFLIAAVRMFGVGGDRDWLPSALLALAVGSLVWWNVSQPEARVVEANLELAEETGRFDVAHADGMSDDAIPALVAGLDRLPPEARRDLERTLCRPDPEYRWHSDWEPHLAIDPDGTVNRDERWARWSLSTSRSARALASCAD